MNEAKKLIPIATTAALAVFAAQAAAALLGAKDGTLTGAAIKIAGGMAGVWLASKIAR